jgi:energy-coupling factor transporter ATP-binding protein EcfA2
MALTIEHLKEMTSGFAAKGYRCIKRPSAPQNPVRFEWTDSDGTVRKFRLWVYEVTHGGGYRDEEESRIQITNAPSKAEGMDYGGAIDLIMGYSPSRRVLVAYDRRWLEKRMEKGEGSPSVQVKEKDIQAALTKGMHHLTKSSAFGTADIVTLKPELFPDYLRNHEALLKGSMETAAVTTTAGGSNGSLWQFCLDRGFYFDPDLLARYVASLAAKPFVILAGVSGTGKSKMAELVAEFYSATSGELKVAATATQDTPQGDAFAFVPGERAPDPSRFALVPVRPDWIDNQSIMGFVNPITSKYESTQALDLMLRASKALEEAANKATAPRFFMLLDEMNLARVEHYFSDWLACAESRRYQPDGSISQQPIPLHRHSAATATIIGPGNAASEVSVPSSLEIPTNFIVTGTVNVDETTFGFSPKVLDRSMVIEFNEVDLEGVRNGVAPGAIPAFRFPETLPAFSLATTADFKALPQETHDHLVAINKILERAQLHFGYRSAAEISLFMKIYDGILPEDVNDTTMLRALDGALLQKVLPRIQGNRARLEGTLCSLLWYFRELDLPSHGQDVQAIASDDSAKLPMSYKRGFEMLERLRGFGFATFFK